MRSALVIAIGLILAAPASALAKPRVALVTFDGDAGGEAQDVVSEILGEDVMLVGPKQVNRTVDKLGLDTTELADKDLRKLSKELQADAVIQGKLSKKEDHKLLRFKVFLHGKKQKGFKVEFASLKSKKFKTQLHDKFLERLDLVTADAEPPVVAKKAPPPDDEEDPISGKKKKTDDPLATMKKPKKGSGDTDKTDKIDKTDDDSAIAGPKEVADNDDAPKPHHKRVAHADDDDVGVSAHVEVHHGLETMRGANRDAFRLDLGGSVQNRSLTFTSRPQFPQAPKAFDQKPVAGARVAGEFYPLAFGSSEGFASGIGIAGMYDQTIVLSLASAAQPGTKFPVTQRRFEVGPRIRMVFGHRVTSPSITLGVNYMRRTFIVNRSALTAGNQIDLPDVDYVGYDPSLDFRLPLFERLAFVLGGEAILLTSAGPIQNLDQYGQATITGAAGMAGFDIVIAHHIALDLRGEFTQIGYAFKGNGALTKNRDMDPSTPDIGGAADRYLGGSVTLAVLY